MHLVLIFDVRVITKRNRGRIFSLDRAGITDITGVRAGFGLGNQESYAFAMTKEMALF